MPGFETCLEELMSRVLRDLIEEGHVVKIDDDLYCGGSTPEEALLHWCHVLAALYNNNLTCLLGKPSFAQSQQLSLDGYGQMAL